MLSPLLLALAAATAAAPDARPADKGLIQRLSGSTAECPHGVVLKFDPPQWRKRLPGSPVEAVSADLDRLGLSPAWDVERCKDTSKLQVDLFRAILWSPEVTDLVLQVRGEACGEPVLRGVVLHPLDKGTYCSVPLPFLLPAEPYWSATVFAFEHLTDPKRQVFRVSRDESDGHNDGNQTAYWELQHGEVVDLFSIETSNHFGDFMGSQSQSAETRKVGDGYPKQLELRQSTESCIRSDSTVQLPNGDTAEVGDGDMNCSSAESTVRYCYRPTQDGKMRYEKCDPP